MWKPWVILDALHKAPENAVIIYSDSGSCFKKSLLPLIQLTKEYDILLAEYEDIKKYGRARSGIKRDVFVKLKCDKPEFHDGPSLWAGFMILRNTAVARDFIKNWLDLVQDSSLLLPGDKQQDNLPGFNGHKYDQALLTILYALNKKGKYLIPYDSELSKYVSWHHRVPHPTSNPLSVYESILKYIFYEDLNMWTRGFFGYIYNSRVMCWIRK